VILDKDAFDVAVQTISASDGEQSEKKNQAENTCKFALISEKSYTIQANFD
jgi:hypothetical protein